MPKAIILFVGMAGFEPTTSSTPCWRDTGLRYIPKFGTTNIYYPTEIKNFSLRRLQVLSFNSRQGLLTF